MNQQNIPLEIDKNNFVIHVDTKSKQENNDSKLNHFSDAKQKIENEWINVKDPRKRILDLIKVKE